MSATTTRLTLQEARRLAGIISDMLHPGCDRIEVAGSIRRERPDIGDLELVAIPKRTVDLLGGEGDSLLEPIIDRMKSERKLVKIKGGDRYKQFKVMDKDFQKHGAGGTICRLDLFLCCPETWGCVFTIRTGSTMFSHSLVTSRALGGYCPSHLRFNGGRLWHGETALPTPEEADVFKACELEWREPRDR